MRLTLPDVAATEAVGQALAEAIPMAACIYLRGPLGAGKTALVRALLRGLGYSGVVKSPTYSLMELYQVAGRMIIHLDLYRLADPVEIETLGLRDYATPATCWLVEWPERGTGGLPPADLVVELCLLGRGRELRFNGISATGQEIIRQLQKGAIALCS